MAKNPEFNQYRYVSRKVFDAWIDRNELRTRRMKEDHRNDLGALQRRVAALETQLQINERHGCRDPTCKFCDFDDISDNGNEELE